MRFVINTHWHRDHTGGNEAFGAAGAVIAALDAVLPLRDERTQIIPGHGPVASRADLRAYRAMLATVRDRVAKMIAAGREVIAAQPTQEFDAKWGGGFMKPDQWVQRLYVDLERSTD